MCCACSLLADSAFFITSTKTAPALVRDAVGVFQKRCLSRLPQIMVSAQTQKIAHSGELDERGTVRRLRDS